MKVYEMRTIFYRIGIRENVAHLREIVERSVLLHSQTTTKTVSASTYIEWDLEIACVCRVGCNAKLSDKETVTIIESEI